MVYGPRYSAIGYMHAKLIDIDIDTKLGNSNPEKHFYIQFENN